MIIIHIPVIARDKSVKLPLTDHAYWLPRFAQLKDAVSGFTGDVIRRLDPDALLCAMEDAEE